MDVEKEQRKRMEALHERISEGSKFKLRSPFKGFGGFARKHWPIDQGCKGNCSCSK